MAQKIEEITSSPLQTLKFELEDGSIFEFDLNYMVQQQGWFFNIRYQDFTLNGVRISLNINLLDQFKNLIPFGFMVTSKDNIEPINLNDFQVDRVQLSVLNEQEILDIEDFLNNQKDTAGEV